MAPDRGLQIETAERGLVLVEVGQRSPALPVGLVAPAAGLGEGGAHGPRLQAGRDRIVGAQPDRVAGDPVGLPGAAGGASGEDRGGRGQPGPARLVVQAGRAQQVSEAGRPLGGAAVPPLADEGGDPHVCGEHRPAVRAPAREPPLRAGGELPCIGPALLQQGQLRAAQLDLRQVLPARIGLEQRARPAQVAVGVAEQPGGDEHLRPVGVVHPGEHR
jgi:hypothetical protein